MTIIIITTTLIITLTLINYGMNNIINYDNVDRWRNDGRIDERMNEGIDE